MATFGFSILATVFISVTVVGVLFIIAAVSELIPKK